MATPMGLLHKQLGRVIMPKRTTLYDPKPERKGHSRIRAQYRSFIIISILIHLLTPSPHVSLPYGTNVEIEHASSAQAEQRQPSSSLGPNALDRRQQHQGI